MSIAIGALIASASLVLSGIVLGVPLVSAELAVAGTLIPWVLTGLTAVVVVMLRRYQRREQLPLRPALFSLVVWSVVGVPVLCTGSYFLPFLLAAGDENSQAVIVMLCFGLILNGLWIAPLISLVVAAGVGTDTRKATVR